MIDSITASAPPLWVISAIILLWVYVRSSVHARTPTRYKLPMLIPALCIAALYLIFSLSPIDSDLMRFSSRYGLLALYVWDIFFLLITRKYHV